MFKFEIKAEDKKTKARTGKITTTHGEVETPVFMPVATRAVVKTLTVEELEQVGAQMILGNAYHLYLRPGIEVIKKAGNLGKFMGWNGPLLTDSGGYQIFSLGETFKIRNEGVEFKSIIDGSTHFLSPEDILDIQRVLGSDVCMVLDVCSSYPSERRQLEQAMKTTFNWAKRSKEYFDNSLRQARLLTPERSNGEQARLPHYENYSGGQARLPSRRPSGSNGGQALFGIVQGGVFPDLRKRSAGEIAGLDFAGYGIGGFSVGEPHELMFEILEQTLDHLPVEKPRYLMGVGNPTSMVKAISFGIDMFDSALPTRMARNGTVFTTGGRVNIRNAKWAEDSSPLDSSCPCCVCKNYSRMYLSHLYRRGEILAHRLLTFHNLFFVFKLMKEARGAIKAGNFAQFRLSYIEGTQEDKEADS